MHDQIKRYYITGTLSQSSPALMLLLLLLTACVGFPKTLDQTPAILIYNEGEEKFAGGFYPKFYVDIYNSKVQLIAEKQKLPVINGINIIENLPPGKLGKLDFFYKHSRMKYYDSFKTVSCDEVLSRGDIMLLGYKLRTHNLSSRLMSQSIGFTAWVMKRGQADEIMTQLQNEEDLTGFNLRLSHEELIK